MKKPKVERHETILPIYGARVQLIIADDIARERKAQEHLFGPVPAGDSYDALCSYSYGHNFALFFEPGAVTHRIVGHELFHLTHRVLEWVGAPFRSDNHEVFAAIHGELNQWVYDIIADKIRPDTLNTQLSTK